MIKKKLVTLILYSFTPSDMNFQTFLVPKMILAKKIHKKSTHLDHSHLKYTLENIDFPLFTTSYLKKFFSVQLFKYAYIS